MGFPDLQRLQNQCLSAEATYKAQLLKDSLEQAARDLTHQTDTDDSVIYDLRLKNDVLIAKIGKLRREYGRRGRVSDRTARQ